MRGRRAGTALLAGWLATGSLAADPGVIAEAAYGEPTRRYAHGILGDDIEWGALVLTLAPCSGCAAEDVPQRVTHRLPPHRVFEDVSSRLVDLDDTGAPYAIVVESDAEQGARLGVYDADGFVAATPFIGRAYRWLAPLGAADLDDDGAMELAYVDRPHLKKELRIWRWRDGSLSEVARAPGVTNHRIGEPDIGGGIRDCGGPPEIIAASVDWQRVLGLTLGAEGITRRDLGPYRDRDSFARALAC
jgi:hypothetical protein